MKGIELLSSFVSFLVMLGISIFLGGVIIGVLNVARAWGVFIGPAEYEMGLSPLYPPINYEDMLLSYLETTIELTDGTRFQIKKVLVYAAYQKNVTNVFVDGKEVTTLIKSSYKIFSNWIGNYGYILVLNIGGEPYILAENRGALGITPDRMLIIRRVSIPTYIDSESVIGKTRELPLDVTLDLYVQ